MAAQPASAAAANLPGEIEDTYKAFVRALPGMMALAGENKKAVEAVAAQHVALDRLLWEARATRLERAAAGFKTIAADADKAKVAAKRELQSLQNLKQTLDAVSAFLNIASRLITEFRV